MDRAVYMGLMIFALGVLTARSFRWDLFFTRNVAFAMFLSFALVSAVWSDFTLISLKRWFRDMGNYLMILMVLTEPFPTEAIRVVVRRLCFLLIPLSIVLIKYYPQLGRVYDRWAGTALYSGATTSKNMLGVLCMISGLFFLWDTLKQIRGPKTRERSRIILLNCTLMLMTLWLLSIANSKTSSICLVIGSVIILASQTKVVEKYPTILKVAVPTIVLAYVFTETVLGIDVTAVIARLVGRDPSLTGRDHIWRVVLSMGTNPLVGTGYESFWLGPRLLEAWSRAGNGLNQAHNGYLEVYLNLGMIGLCLLGWFLVSSFQVIWRNWVTSGFGPFNVALWCILMFYNVTEAAFKTQFVWLLFLFGALDVPRQLILSAERAISQQVGLPRAKKRPQSEQAEEEQCYWFVRK
ncbi:MAG: O-antigen ligase family protein [Bryobacteraceae bacterium]|nr:O-antigen ligase family protein [Bryobacteraceae bacterium]